MRADRWSALFFGHFLTFWASAYTYSTVVGTLTVVESLNHEKHIPVTFNLNLFTRGWTTAFLIRVIKILLFQIPDKHTMTLSAWCLYTIMIDILLSGLYIRAVHTIIARPSASYFYLSSWRTFLQIIPAAVVASVARSLNFFIPYAILKTSLYDSMQPYLLLLSSAVVYFLVTAPAQAVFIRVSASRLSEKDLPIVTLDDKIRGNGGIGMVTAWTSWERRSYINYYQALVKAFILKVSTWVCFGWLMITVYEPYVWDIIWVAA
ncbi:hypothetical protein ASPZODRAFT_135311 [Penicilliopsis zonata CBS 506.65]|uniref:Uncharacterized protein n=1 Tax=Penicilliopsis zonata CBS 506.65 TaxID=1073090 RepID=A0A1L9SBE2_9EURO|nr:hypothetical protein ASPZODRAFT_135311 [Penicilliopsis zonata CBS 506.65]OJJ44500.1 hypothetical protein ASPZODRAFT_135311 [Penicilliopsis zonata CBS 506.65]